MTLNARLLTGLLAITTAGLAIMGLVSALVLNGYLMHRVDGQLQATRDRAVTRLLRPGLPEQGVAPAQFVVLAVGPAGRVRVLSGDAPAPEQAVREVGRLGPDELAARARDLEPFSLPGLRAVARPWGKGFVVVASPLTEIHAAVRNLVLSEIATAALLLAVLLVLGRWLIRRGLLPLSRMAATAHAITAGGDLRARMPAPGRRTEVARLASAINVMLERIEQAFWARSRSEARVREFAADASHELRTPLTAIQGYAELYRHGALGPDELPDAMRRIEEEARRMNSLVTDLLELARLDREASLHPAPTDLAALARDAVADATVAAPDRPIVLDAPDTLVATVDEARIRQVFANLLANVRAHTPPGTPTTIRLAPGLIEVADEGPGMSPEDAARAFERFHRGTQGGTGLGLPIVAAIAAAHGGRAELLSEPSKGTIVRITLGSH
ncbi:sensor histidine kinase [Actinomadura citrea]|uniref:histidine kinase n=1 Tax=Actinomadura citrea TaxID=46158 RepID=A0A7Y9G527_9ACTN|nr:HAMP domain-containing sensor histidine kinase [Actinomadura citrea]NYE10122.1 two-component system OmpR family sensor kinase [Actinomadura citrea]GGT70190.1 two-component sensor histidine kinase [Actinomadura citrea]